MIGKYSIKYHYLRNKIFTVTYAWHILLIRITGTRNCKDFKIKNLHEHHDLYFQRNTSLLANVFENFRKMCLKIYELNPAHFLSVPGLAWRATFKKIKVKLDLLTDTDMLLMVENSIIGGICHVIHRYTKANNKYMKDYDKNKVSLNLMYWDVTNL